MTDREQDFWFFWLFAVPMGVVLWLFVMTGLFLIARSMISFILDIVG